MSVPLSGLPGAVLAATENAVEHFGSPLKEGRAFEMGRALVARSDLALLAVTGADRLSWLDSFTSQSLKNLQPGDSAETLLLSPQGKIEQQIAVFAGVEAVYLMVPDTQAQTLFDFLQRMRFALRVEVADLTADHALFDLCVPRTALPVETAEQMPDTQLFNSLLAVVEAPLGLWIDPWFVTPIGGVQYYSGSHPAETSVVRTRAILPRTAYQQVAIAAAEGELQLAGVLALAAFEVAHWKPGYAELDERSLPHEYDLLRSDVHLNKGCYRGQETVAKVHNLGHPPRRLVQVDIDGSGGELPAAGDKLFAGADPSADPQLKPVGKLTRVVMHHELGPIALALVKRNAPTTEQYWVQLGDGTAVAASVTTIVPPEAGAVNALDPAIRRAMLSI